MTSIKHIAFSSNTMIKYITLWKGITKMEPCFQIPEGCPVRHEDGFLFQASRWDRLAIISAFQLPCHRTDAVPGVR